MTQRYERQLPLIGDVGQRTLSESCVAIIGCGGLGSTVITNLSCAGLGHMILVDGDNVSESNLNRQFIHAGSIGRNKAESAASWVSRINPECKVTVIPRYLGHSDSNVLDDADVVVDCLDSSEARMMLADMCLELGKVLVHAAVDGYYGQVATIRPEDMLRMEHIYPKPSGNVDHPAIASAVGTIGSLEANEVLNVLLGSDSSLRDEILSVDIECHSMNRYRLGTR